MGPKKGGGMGPKKKGGAKKKGRAPSASPSRGVTAISGESTAPQGGGAHVESKQGASSFRDELPYRGPSLPPAACDPGAASAEVRAEACVVIQSAYRGSRARCIVRRQYCAVKFLQRVGRGYLVRRRLGEMQRLAIQEEEARLMQLDMDAAASQMGAASQGSMSHAEVMERRRRGRMERAAAYIQARARGMLTRNKVKEMRERKLTCVCNRVAAGRMLVCAGCMDAFHATCVGLEGEKHGGGAVWVCPNCDALAAAVPSGEEAGVGGGDVVVSGREPTPASALLKVTAQSIEHLQSILRARPDLADARACHSHESAAMGYDRPLAIEGIAPSAAARLARLEEIRARLRSAHGRVEDEVDGVMARHTGQPASVRVGVVRWLVENVRDPGGRLIFAKTTGAGAGGGKRGSKAKKGKKGAGKSRSIAGSDGMSEAGSAAGSRGQRPRGDKPTRPRASMGSTGDGPGRHSSTGRLPKIQAESSPEKKKQPRASVETAVALPKI